MLQEHATWQTMPRTRQGRRRREVRPGRVEGERSAPGAGAAERRSAAACGDPITSNLYDADQEDRGPADLARHGIARLWQSRRRSPSSKPGETVLDLGSGGGIDVLLSAKRVGPTGKAYGLDMTDEMLALARENQRKAGLDERRVPEGRDRAHSAAGQFGRRDHLELRDQPVRRQGPRARAKRFACSSPAAASPSPTSSSEARCPTAIRQQHGAVGRLRRRRAR